MKQRCLSLWNPALMTVFSLSLGSTGVIAQSNNEDETLEEIVVTGSFIEGTAKDGQLPVDVYSAEDMEAVGSPSPVQFAKSLSIQGNTSGENGYLSGGVSTTQFNLRALGSARTLSLLNSMRTNQDVNQNPQIALQRMEILREGAAALYGASAVGGVVNTITLPSYEGVKISGEYTHVPDSGAEYDIGFLWGTDIGDFNFYTSLEYENRPEIETVDRPYTLASYSTYSGSSAPFNNPGSFRVVGRAPDGSYYQLWNFANGTFDNINNSQIEDFDENSCETTGGAYRALAATFAVPVCSWNYTDFLAVQSEQEFTRSYSQFSGSIGEDTDFMVSLNLFKSLLPESRRSPSYAVSIGPGYLTGARGGSNQWVVPSSNPYVQDFLSQSGVDLNAVAGDFPGQFDPNNPNTYGFSAYWWLPAGLQGNDATNARAKNGAVASRVENNTAQLNFKLDGDISEINWKVFGGYRRSTTDNTRPSEFGWRIQEALNGFGGPNCNAVDEVPYVAGDRSTWGTQNSTQAGVGGCMYYNPFASAWSNAAVSGNDNPRYVAGNENPVELLNWLYDRSPEKFTTKVTEFNVAFNGELPLELAGGNVGWAAGYQLLETDFSRIQGSPYAVDLGENSLQPCAWPDQQVGDVGCPGAEGPYMFTTLTADVRNQIQRSNALYGEMALPITETLSMQLAARYEEYKSGIDTTVWKWSSRWQATDWMAIRASYGTNFAEPDPSIIPGTTSNFVASIDRAGGRWLGINVVTSDSLKPEVADVWDVGLLFNFSVGDGDMDILLDYFDITINDEVATIAADAIANQVIDAGGNINCAHPLEPLFDWSTGTCAGATPADINRITTFRTNRPGRQVAGIDFDWTYNFSLSGADALFTTGIRSTYTTKYEQESFVYQGIEFEGAVDGNGNLNEGISLEPNSKLRSTIFLNYSQGDHNIRVDYVYRSGLEDNRPQNFDLSFVNDALPNPLPQNTFAEEVKSYGLINLFYTLQASDSLIVRAGINNLADRDPPSARIFMNYLQLQASARGRTAQVGLSYEF